jgi:hypothetical protein
MVGLQRLKVILSPSLVSAPAALAGATFILGSAAWSYITDTQLFYEQLFGPRGVVTLVQIQPHNMGELQSAIMNGAGTYYIFLFAVGLAGGLAIYFVLESISRIKNGVSLFLREAHSDREEARQAVKESMARLAVRISSLLAWALYIIIFTSVLVPFSILVLQDALDAGGVQKWLFAALVAAGLVISVHLHVSLARLVFLRVRLLGGYDAELYRLNSHD